MDVHVRSLKTALLTSVIAVVGSPVGPWAGDPRALGLYDWMFPADVVVAGRVLDEAGKNTAVSVEHVFRGDVEVGEILQVRVKRANRERDEDESRLKLGADRLYVLLLRPETRKHRDGPISYELIRGVHGAREVPKEGASALLDAAERFARVQSVNDDSQQWHSFDVMLEELNPILIQTALDQYLKFRRGAPDLAARVQPLLHHPRPDVRRAALALSGFLLQRFPPGEFPDVLGLEMDIIALARRDPSSEVRIEATVALRGLADDRVIEIWEEISQDDPDQHVRYTAERLLYENELAMIDRAP
jgi:hypothetical protein